MTAVIREAWSSISCLVLLAIPTLAFAQNPPNDCAQQLDAALQWTAPPSSQPRAAFESLRSSLTRQDYDDAYRAGVELLKQPEFDYGTSIEAVLGLLGRPDLMYADPNRASIDVFYNTNGGPLDLSFQACGLIHKSMDTPPRWRGTDTELATLWSKARHSREWWLWRPMTGTISRVDPRSPNETTNRDYEVDLNGGMYGDTGTISVVIPPRKCRGQWSAASGNGVIVTRGRLISEYGPIYFPDRAQPTVVAPFQRVGQAFLQCDVGRTLRLEFVTGPGTPHGWGIGRDDDGAIYRFNF